MRAANQVIASPARRTQLCDAAVPSVPPIFTVPCKAIWQGPSSNSWYTRDLALRARAKGAPTSFALKEMASSTKNCPRGVGVDAFPTTANALCTGRPYL